MDNEILYKSLKKESEVYICLDYYIIPESISADYCDLKCYGIKIEKTTVYAGGGKIVESKQINNIFYRYKDATEFSDTIIKKRIEPQGLRDIVENYIIESIVLTSFIVYMKQFVNIIWFILDLLFGSTTEKRILDILYQIYQNTEIRPTRGKIDLHILENQINYLLDEHIKYAKKVNKKQTDKISFDTNIRLKNDKSNRFKILKRRSLIICSLFNGIFIALYEYENGWKLAIAIVAIYCVVLCFVTYICPELATVFVKILYGKRGYEIVLDKRIMNKRYISEYGICKKGVWYKYINSIKNIVAFAEIVEKTNDRDILYQMIGHIQERCKEDEKLEIVLIIMDYRWNWKKKKNIDVGLREVDKEKYGEFAKAFITDINLENFKRKNTPGQADVLDLSDINKYLQWEQKKNYIRKSLKDKVYALIENVKHKVLLFFI